MSVRCPLPIRVVLAGLGVWLVGLELAAVLPSHPGTGTVFGNWAAEAVQLAAAALCVAAAVRERGRVRMAWLLVAGGIVVWTLGDIYWVTVLSSDTLPPVPSPADVGYLLYVPLVLAGLFTLMRARIKAVSRTVVVDSLIVGIAAATAGAAFVVQPVASKASGGTFAVATNLAYPILDVMLLAAILSVIGLHGWRSFDWVWRLLALGALMFLVADILYLITSANGSYSQPNLFDAGWTASTVLFATAAWTAGEPEVTQRRDTAIRDIALPLVFAFSALVVALLQPVDASRSMTLVLGALCMLTVMVRLVMTFQENAAMIRASRSEAMTDALTGLGNRRALLDDLERRMAAAREGAPLVLLLFDLDGFKYYNDSFGHSAGDVLLARLGRKLRLSVNGLGEAYRLGGDEFCALVDVDNDSIEPVLLRLTNALSERGEGFDIGCSAGAVMLPSEADEPGYALSLADKRMYAAKEGTKEWVGRQITEALWTALFERDSALGSHTDDVASLAEGVARRLGLNRTEVDHVRSAAMLHDIGKLAIPDTILNKPGPLDARDWEFIHSHPLIGERIVAAAPTLAAVAPLVRSSHERFDGKGYPDQLAGADIPLGARIVAVCAAFNTMRTDRSHHAPMDTESALAELRHCVNRLFDPAVVDAFCAEWAARARAAAGGRTAVSRQIRLEDAPAGQSGTSSRVSHHSSP